MSEQLTIEILREKFKEAQEKGQKIVLESMYCVDLIVLDVRKSGVFYESFNGDGYLDSEDFKYWKIKQPKDEYEILYENLSFVPEIGAYRAGFDKNPLHYIDKSFTGRKLLRNKRTGEIVEYSEDLLK